MRAPAVFIALNVLLIAAAAAYYYIYMAGPEPSRVAAPPSAARPASPRESMIVSEPSSAPPGQQSAPETRPAETSGADGRLRDVNQSAQGSIEAGRPLDAIIILKAAEPLDDTGNALMGLAYIKRKELTSGIVYLNRYIDSPSPKDQGSLFAVRATLARAYYGNDQLEKSRHQIDAALGIRDDAELIHLRDKIARELGASANQVGEATLHFRAIFDGYEHGGISRTVLGMLEDAYRDVGRELNHYPSAPVTVILNTKEAFFDITLAPSWSGGIYDGKIRVPVGNSESIDTTELRRILYHEYTHALIRSITPSAPRWLNEGLAERFSRPAHTDRVGQALPLAKLENSWPSGDTRAVMAAYRESREAVDYLIERHGMYPMQGMLEALGRGKSFDMAFEEAYYMSFKEFANTWGSSASR